MRLAAAILAAALAAPVHALEVIRADSTLGFAVAVGTREVTGTFSKWTAEIDLEARRIVVEVETASATTGDALLDAVVHGAEWMGSAAHPVATFVSDEIVSHPGHHRASGVLTMRGARVPLVVTIREPDAFRPIVYTVSAELDRTTAGLVASPGIVGTAVRITGDISVRP